MNYHPCHRKKCHPVPPRLPLCRPVFPCVALSRGHAGKFTPLAPILALRAALADILAKHSKIPPTEKKAG